MAIELISRISNLSPNVTEAHLRELISMDALGERAVRIKKITMPAPVLWQACPHGRAEVVGVTDEDTIKIYGVLHGSVVDGNRVNVSFAKVNHALPPSKRPVVKGSSTAASTEVTTSLANASRHNFALGGGGPPEAPPARRFRVHGKSRRSRSCSSYSRSLSSTSDSSRSSERYKRRRRKSDRVGSRYWSDSSSSRFYRRRGTPDAQSTRLSSRHTSSMSSTSSRSYSSLSSRSTERRCTRSRSSTKKSRREKRTPRQRTLSTKR